MKLKRLIVPGVVAGLIGVALTMPIGADDGVITTTVTPLVLSVSVSPNSYDYQEMEFSQDNSTRSTAQTTTAFTVTNIGSITSDIEIRGDDATPAEAGEATWQLDCSSATLGAIGLNQFVHRFAFGDSPDFGSGGKTLCDESNKPLAQGVNVDGSFGFKLELHMPTDSTGLSERSTSVTVIAVEPAP